jgi:hypothetical protein
LNAVPPRRQIRYELRETGQLAALVTDDDGAEIAIAHLIDRLGAQRVAQETTTRPDEPAATPTEGTTQP